MKFNLREQTKKTLIYYVSHSIIISKTTIKKSVLEMDVMGPPSKKNDGSNDTPTTGGIKDFIAQTTVIGKYF